MALRSAAGQLDASVGGLQGGRLARRSSRCHLRSSGETLTALTVVTRAVPIRYTPWLLLPLALLRLREFKDGTCVAQTEHAFRLGVLSFTERGFIFDVTFRFFLTGFAWRG